MGLNARIISNKISFLCVIGQLIFSILSYGNDESSIDDHNLDANIFGPPDSFYDEKVDYSRFKGRITDKNSSNNIIKIKSESRNIKYFRAGDQIGFQVARAKNSGICKGYIRRIEKDYFIIYTKNVSKCWKDKYLRRGTIVIIHSNLLAKRIKKASGYRALLLQRRIDFHKQLNEINHFLWTYRQQKLKLVAQYNERIIRIERKKQHALENLLNKKKEQLSIQQELIFRLNKMDEDLKYYRIEKEQYLVDRWHLKKND